MKKIVATLFSIGISAVLFSQNITLDPPSEEIIGDPDIIQEVHITLHNAGDHQTMTWKRTINDIPAGWTSSVCDFNLCWSPVADAPSYFFEAPGDTSGTVYVKFDARNYHDGAFDPVPGCGTVEVVFYSVTDSANYNAVGVFNAKLGVENCGDAIFYSPLLDNSFLVYPNPANGEINIIASNSADVRSVEILNIVGKAVFTTGWQTGNGKMSLNLGNLPEGIYFVRLLDVSGKPVHTEKLSLTK
ncbi:MAG: T9SS type A sorting domain-containing protein [Chitinophagales bacterium]